MLTGEGWTDETCDLNEFLESLLLLLMVVVVMMGHWLVIWNKLMIGEVGEWEN